MQETEYEKLRKQRIEQNQTKLLHLQITNLDNGRKIAKNHHAHNRQGQTKGKSWDKKDGDKYSSVAYPTRISERLWKKLTEDPSSAVNYWEPPEKAITASTRSRSRQKYETATEENIELEPDSKRPKTRAAILLPNSKSTRSLTIHTDQLKAKYLGLPIFSPDSQLKRHLVQALSQVSFYPTFNRMSGICEFDNAILLFVNLPDPTEQGGACKYVNHFKHVCVEEGEQALVLEWFAQATQTEESQVISRIIQASKAALKDYNVAKQEPHVLGAVPEQKHQKHETNAVAVKEEARLVGAACQEYPERQTNDENQHPKTRDSVILVVRAPSSIRQRDFYVYLGELGYVSHDSSHLPVRFEFIVLESKVLQTLEIFRSALRYDYEKMNRLAQKLRSESNG